MLGGRALHDLLLEPTRIYVRAVLALLREIPVHSIAHITGGGLSGNIPRTLPSGVEAVIDARRWQRPAVFDWLQRTGWHRRCGDVPHLQLRSRDDACASRRATPTGRLRSLRRRAKRQR